jgi:hypothetical protein
MRAAVDHLFREGQLLTWGVAATGVLVETLLDRGVDGDVAEAEAATERLAAAPADDGLVMREVWLLRLRVLLARARGDDAAYRDSVNRYREMAESLGFEGHLAWAQAMLEVIRRQPSPLGRLAPIQTRSSTILGVARRPGARSRRQFGVRRRADLRGPGGYDHRRQHDAIPRESAQTCRPNRAPRADATPAAPWSWARVSRRRPKARHDRRPALPPRLAGLGC